MTPHDERRIRGRDHHPLGIGLSRGQAVHLISEFHRVLKPDGQISMWELINRFSCPEPPRLFHSYNMTPAKSGTVTTFVSLPNPGWSTFAKRALTTMRLANIMDE